MFSCFLVFVYLFVVVVSVCIFQLFVLFLFVVQCFIFLIFPLHYQNNLANYYRFSIQLIDIAVTGLKTSITVTAFQKISPLQYYKDMTVTFFYRNVFYFIYIICCCSPRTGLCLFLCSPCNGVMFFVVCFALPVTVLCCFLFWCFSFPVTVLCFLLFIFVLLSM